MTDRQALAWARKRWGTNAMIRANDRHPQETSRRAVGVLALGMFFEVRGTGANWQAACDDVAAREQRDHERYEAARRTTRGQATLPAILAGLALSLAAVAGIGWAGNHGRATLRVLARSAAATACVLEGARCR